MCLKVQKTVFYTTFGLDLIASSQITRSVFASNGPIGNDIYLSDDAITGAELDGMWCVCQIRKCGGQFHFVVQGPH